MKCRSRGFTLPIMVIALMAVMLVLSEGAKQLQRHEEKVRIQRTADILTSLLVGLDDYFVAECHANSGVVTAPSSVNVLVDLGYLIPGEYTNPLGSSFSFAIERSLQASRLSVATTFRNQADARKVAQQLAGYFDAQVSGAVLVVAQTADRDRDHLLGAENRAFATSLCL